MVYVEPIQEGEAGFFPQLHEKPSKGSEVGYVEGTALTRGRFHVTEINAWDEERHLV